MLPLMSAPHEVRATGFELNMAGWCAEKSEGAVASIVRSLSLLKNIDGTESAQAQLRLALGYATKLYAFGMGAEWCMDDPALVLEHGVEALTVAYGGLAETAQDRSRENDRLYAAIEALLAGPASPNRTQLHELLRTERYRQNARLVRFAELLEQVTQGELTWTEFVGAANAEVAAARAADCLES